MQYRKPLACIAVAAVMLIGAGVDAGDPCLADLNEDNIVDPSDLLVLLGFWGTCADCDDCVGDFDQDCQIGAADLLTLLGDWGPCPVAGCLEPPAGMVSWWPADGNALDIGGANHGAVMNGATFADGIVGKALELDGVDDYVHLGNDPSLELQWPVTIEAWVKLDSETDGAAIFASDNWDGPLTRYNGIKLSINAEGFLTISFGDGGPETPSSRRTKVGTTFFQPNIWRHVAGVIRGPVNMSLYIDGVDDGGEYSGSGGSIVNYTVRPATIGVRAIPPETPFGGQIDELSVYDRALDGSELAAIYEAGSAGKCKD